MMADQPYKCFRNFTHTAFSDNPSSGLEQHSCNQLYNAAVALFQIAEHTRHVAQQQVRMTPCKTSSQEG
jgi:hypothetical protein